MRPKNLLGLILSVALVACGSDYGVNTPVEPAPPAAAVLLKEINIPNLPSPFYHFEYDSQGRINVASFASGFTAYTVSYDGAGRIKEMANDAVGNRDKLEYSYDQVGRVDTVRYIDPNGVNFTTVSLSYKGAQLVGLERRRLLNDQLVLEKSMSFSYFADGNLMELVEHRPAVADRQTETTSIDRFEQYDDKINVDGFSLIHNDFFDHLVLLPGVTLQKNNPGKETLIGDGDGANYTVAYTYTFDSAGRPLTKNGIFMFTAGPDAGKVIPTLSTFSYY